MEVTISAHGLYDWIEKERKGTPEGSNRFPDDLIPSGSQRFVLYLQLTGDAGEYVLSSQVKAFTEQPGVTLVIPDMLARINPGRKAHVRIPFDTQELPMGRYEIVISINSAFGARLWFDLGH